MLPAPILGGGPVWRFDHGRHAGAGAALRGLLLMGAAPTSSSPALRRAPPGAPVPLEGPSRRSLVLHLPPPCGETSPGPMPGRRLVPRGGFEPPTSGSKVPRATSCTTGEGVPPADPTDPGRRAPRGAAGPAPRPPPAAGRP